MADPCCQYTFAGVKVNDTTANANRLMIGDDGEITGLDGRPIRAEIDPQGQSDGGIVHPKLYGPRIITFSGEVHIQTTTPADLTAYLTAMNTLEAAVISALEGQLNTEANLTWTPTGGSGKTIACTYGIEGGEVQFSGAIFPGERKFTFTLVADNPVIS